MILPASEQQKWHSWSSCTAGCSPQQLLSPVQWNTEDVWRVKQNSTQAVIKLNKALRLTNILDFISCPTKKREGNTDEGQYGKQYPLEGIIRFNIKNIYSPSNSFETLWISLYQKIKENTLARSQPHSLLCTGRKWFWQSADRCLDC